jgi:hypothetical protein
MSVISSGSTSNSSRGCGHSAKTRSQAAINFSRAVPLTHDHGSPSGAGPAARAMRISLGMSRFLLASG